MNKSFALIAFLLLLQSCGGFVKSTVDAYGEIPKNEKISLMFVRDGATLDQKQLINECEKGAIDSKMNVVSSCKSGYCLDVLAVGSLGGSQQVTDSYAQPATSTTTYGTYGQYSANTTGSQVFTDSYTTHNRFIVISIRKGQKEVHNIKIRSTGKSDSIAAVARAMCEAGFKDFPRNINGERYRFMDKN